MIVSTVKVLEQGIVPNAWVRLFKTDEEANKFMEEALAEWISTRSNIKVDKLPNYISAYNDQEVIEFTLEYHKL